MNVNDLSPKQIEKLRACHTPEEILALAKEEGRELNDEELDSIAGGEGFWDETPPIITCTACGKEFENTQFYVFLNCPLCGAYIGPYYS